MNSDTLKTEHARYKQTLKDLRDRYPATADAYKMADAALNPPPPTPVTLDSLLSALKKFNITRSLSHIDFFADESGRIVSNGKWLFDFISLQEAYDFLNQ